MPPLVESRGRLPKQLPGQPPRPAPIWIISATFLSLLALLVACGGGDKAPTGNSDPQLAEGQRLFQANCTSCHSLKADVRVIGPSLAGVSERAATRTAGLSAEAYIRQSIVDPDAYVVDGFNDLMPKNFGNRFDEKELAALTAYLMALE
ncbi:MAG: cytochrome c [Candidatus Promineifilaceae bacterium]|nr:cytochrome c [Candidatus Promineifilaceae bacterium]